MMKIYCIFEMVLYQFNKVLKWNFWFWRRWFSLKIQVIQLVEREKVLNFYISRTNWGTWIFQFNQLLQKWTRTKIFIVQPFGGRLIHFDPVFSERNKTVFRSKLSNNLPKFDDIFVCLFVKISKLKNFQFTI